MATVRCDQCSTVVSGIAALTRHMVLKHGLGKLVGTTFGRKS